MTVNTRWEAALKTTAVKLTSLTQTTGIVRHLLEDSSDHYLPFSILLPSSGSFDYACFTRKLSRAVRTTFGLFCVVTDKARSPFCRSVLKS